MRLPISPAENTKNGSDTSLPPSAWTVTVLHHVSDVIQSNLKWRINPNSPAKVRRFFGICKLFAILIKNRVPLFPCGMKDTKKN